MRVRCIIISGDLGLIYRYKFKPLIQDKYRTTIQTCKLSGDDRLWDLCMAEYLKTSRQHFMEVIRKLMNVSPYAGSCNLIPTPVQ